MKGGLGGSLKFLLHPCNRDVIMGDDNQIAIPGQNAKPESSWSSQPIALQAFERHRAGTHMLLC